MFYKKLELVPATEQDIFLLYNLTQIGMSHLNSQQKEYSKSEKQEHFEKYKMEFLPQIPNTSFITLDKKPIGRLRIERDTHIIHIGGIQLLPEYTGQGYGSLILRDLINEAEVNKRDITLMVHKKNERAIKFYTNKGFIVSEETEKKYKMIFKIKPA